MKGSQLISIWVTKVTQERGCANMSLEYDSYETQRLKVTGRDKESS